MKIEGAEITINQSSIFSLETPDSVEDCLIKVKKSEPGVEHPIRIKSGAQFKNNHILSEIPSPILLDTDSGYDFLGTGGNYIANQEEEK